MRWRPLMWLLLSIGCFGAAWGFWRLGNQWMARPAALPTQAAQSSRAAASAPELEPESTLPVPSLRAGPGNLNAPAPSPKPGASSPSRFAYRLANTRASMGELVRNPQAILLENALLDSGQPMNVSIPEP